MYIFLLKSIYVYIILISMIFGLWVVFYMNYYIKKPFESIENIKNIKYEINNVNRFLTCIVKPNNEGLWKWNLYG